MISAERARTIAYQHDSDLHAISTLVKEAASKGRTSCDIAVSLGGDMSQQSLITILIKYGYHVKKKSNDYINLDWSC